MELHLASVWESIADAIPDEPVLVHGDDVRTWAMFDDRASRLAMALLKNGIRAGTTVAIDMFNCNEFIEALPADPFDGKPLRLTATADGIVIYSVGSNMTDEGGAVVSKPGEQLSADYGFRLLHPSRRGVKFIPSDELALHRIH